MLVIADDLGWGDLGCYGSPWLKTPNINSIAKLGCRYTDYYCVSPKCSPTRASIITGRYPARRRVYNVVTGNSDINAETDTVDALTTKGSQIGKMFQRRGYSTAYFGKWHLGNMPHSPPTSEYGFDVAKVWAGRPSFWTPHQSPESYTIIDSQVTDEALLFLENREDAPFLMLVGLANPHAPLNPPVEYQQIYSGYANSDRVHYTNAF